MSIYKKYNQSGFAPLILIIGAILIAAVGVSTVVVVNNITSERPATKAEPVEAKGRKIAVSTSTPRPTSKPEKAKDNQKPSPTATASSTPTSTPSPVVPAIPSLKTETGVTSTGWAYTGIRDVKVIPYTRSDKKAIYIDFERVSFNNIASIAYDLTYDTNEQASTRGTEGNFNPEGETTATNGANQNIRKEATLGDCSKSVCTYHSNPHNFKLVVKSMRQGSSVVSEQTLTLSTL